MINYVIDPLLSLKKAFMAAACAASYVAEKVAAVTCPADRKEAYDSCRHNSREIREYVLRITKHPNDEVCHIAELIEMDDCNIPYRGYPRLMECFENMLVPVDQAESSQINQLAGYASAFMGAYTRLPTRTRAALCMSLQLQKHLILSAFEGRNFE